MPIRFSTLNEKNLEDTKHIIGLFSDNLSESGESNCIINTRDFAKNSDLETLDETVGELKTTVNNNVVHKTGNETIAGVKTFTDVPIITRSGDTSVIYFKNTSMNRTVNPSSNAFTHCQFIDTNNSALADIYLRDTPTERELKLHVLDKNGTTRGNLLIGCDSNNVGYVKCDSPAAGDNSTKIATTSWVNSYLSTILDSLYPFGSIYIGTQSTCPLARLISGSTWTLVSSGKALWTGTGSNGNTFINAGLPEIYAKGFMGDAGAEGGNYKKFREQGEGALRYIGKTYYGSRGGIDDDNCTGEFKASNGETKIDGTRKNDVYGKSDTVQPPAYVVNVWRRTDR